MITRDEGREQHQWTEEDKLHGDCKRSLSEMLVCDDAYTPSFFALEINAWIEKNVHRGETTCECIFATDFHVDQNDDVLRSGL